MKVTRTNLVEVVLATITGIAGNPNEFDAKREQILANQDAHKTARKWVLEDEARGMETAEIYAMAIAKCTDSEKRALLETKLNAVNDYLDWKKSLENVETERESALAPYREILTAICAITGDKIQHVTHIPKGNKTGATGERINHGNMAYIVDMTTGERVLHPHTHEEKWHSANEALRHFAPEKLSYMYEMVETAEGKREKKLDESGQPIPVRDKHNNHKTYNVNGETAVRILKQKNLEVQFI